MIQLELEDLSSGRRYPVAGEAVIGRDRARTDVTLSDDAISKRHARVFEEEGAWFLEDLGSSNGSFIDKLRIDRRAPLAPGDIFRLADHRFRLVEAGDTDDASPTDETEADLRGSRPSVSRPPPGTLIQRAHPDEPPGPSLRAGLIDGLRFFARAVPHMALNPFGYVRRVIQEQPAAPREDIELAAFSGVAALGVGAALALALLPRDLFAAAIAAVAAALAAGFSALLGLYAHRLLRALVDWLEGDSSPRSRTNALLSGMVLCVLSAVPAVLQAAAPSLPLPYLGVIAPALSFLASLVGLFFLWQWAGYFDLKRWARYLSSGLGLLGACFAGFVLVGAVMGYARAPEGALPIRVVHAETPEAAALNAGSPEIAPAQPIEASATRALPEPEAAQPEAPDPSPEAPAPTEAAPKAEEPAPTTPIEAAPKAEEESPYMRFSAARAAIEAALDRDPGLLGRDRKLRRAYSLLCREEHKIRQDFAKRSKRAKPWELEKILPRQEAAERFQKTKRLVEQLSARLGH